MPERSSSTPWDVVVVGGGHNGLVAAALLARAGRSVVVLERRGQLGGAVASHQPFPGVEASLSRYSYLVSLLPTVLVNELGLEVELRRRRVASYSPVGDQGLLVADDERTQSSMNLVTDDPGAYPAWQTLHGMLGRVAQKLFPTLTQPLRSREDIRRLIDDTLAWTALFEQPLSALLERALPSDLLRGIVATDATIGTFANVDDHQLRQNRCFLYHVIGNGTGRWDVPVGGMGRLARKLADAAQRAGAQLRVGAEVQAVHTDGRVAEAVCSDGQTYRAEHVLAGVAPAILARLLGDAPGARACEGSQLKVNMVVSRLPGLRDQSVTREEAFAGTLHVNEGYQQLSVAYNEAAKGQIPSVPPCEVYCHSLTDPSILSSELRQAGAHTLTLFGLHMPARLFAAEPDARRQEALSATLASVNSVLAEPLEDCLLADGDGNACLEVVSPLDLESELAMPGGHIFHRDLSWPFAESQEEVGLWGVETEHPNVWLCGAGARRGGGVSGIPGHNAARAVLAKR